MLSWWYGGATRVCIHTGNANTQLGPICDQSDAAVHKHIKDAKLTWAHTPCMLCHIGIKMPGHTRQIRPNA